MKNERRGAATSRSGDYTRLKQKVFGRFLTIIVSSCAAILLLRLLALHRVGNMLVELIKQVFRMDHATAQNVYQVVVRNNLDFLIIAAMIICAIILVRFMLSWFTKYFDELASGLDAVAKGEEEISLSAEMGFLERKLISLRQTLERREYEAAQEEQKKNDLVMYLAHDLKTPLTSVIGYLSLLDEAPDMSDAQRAKYLRITLDKANRLEHLINEFFEITRLNLRSITLEKRQVDLYYMLVQMADEFYPHLAASGKRAVIRAPQDITVTGDPDKLARVFTNIWRNAISYGTENSVIEITAEAVGDTVRLCFTNEGTISQSKLESIFEKFYRLDEARSTDTGGAGLGLAIAKEIVTLHGGEITAVSEDGRTVFTVTLPIEAVQ